MLCSQGSGDVDTSKCVAAKDGVLAGLTGRDLKVPLLLLLATVTVVVGAAAGVLVVLLLTWLDVQLPAAWPQDGEYHVGIKALYELLPSAVTERVKV